MVKKLVGVDGFEPSLDPKATGFTDRPETPILGALPLFVNRAL